MVTDLPQHLMPHFPKIAIDKNVYNQREKKARTSKTVARSTLVKASQIGGATFPVSKDLMQPHLPRAGNASDSSTQKLLHQNP